MRRRGNSGPSFRYSGAYTSPGTPEYGDYSIGGLPKGWSSERVPLPTNSSRRHVAASALMPFNSGVTIPSKWDDAERWITSPFSGYGALRTSAAQLQRQPKSKSGPLGPTGLAYLPGYSPTILSHERGDVRNYMENSPLTTGVLAPEGLSVHYENNIARSVSVPGLSDFLDQTFLQDDKHDVAKEDEPVISRRDMATQISPVGSSHSSAKGRLSFSTLPSSVPCVDSNPAGKDDVRDVQVDKGTAPARQSKKQGLNKMESTNAEDFPAVWDVAEASKNISKYVYGWFELHVGNSVRLHREEAKIIAWENLQKAKADAAIQNLEVKLEKKRSASMDRITNKLRGAQMKARAMRNSLSNEASRTSQKGFSYRVHVGIRPICGFFLCSKT